jgi:hypothetical protein
MPYIEMVTGLAVDSAGRIFFSGYLGGPGPNNIYMFNSQMELTVVAGGGIGVRYL